jgi:hypothetical protein
VTIAICLKVGDGVVLGTDSAASLIGENDRYFNVYNNAEKTINLVKGLPIGLMTYGLGGLAGLSIGSLARDLRQRLSGEDPLHPEWAIDPSAYTVEKVAQRVRDFFYDELYVSEFGNPNAQGSDAADGEWDGEGGAPGTEVPEFPALGFVVAGLSAGSYYSEVWTVSVESDGRCTGPEQKFSQGESGVVDFWGMPEALYRLVYGWSHEAHLRLVDAGITPVVADQLLVSRTELAHTGMPLQDAIDLVKYLADVTVGYVRFKQGVPSVAPPVDIAVVTRHQGFKWVARKHYFARDLNPPFEAGNRPANQIVGAR